MEIPINEAGKPSSVRQQPKFNTPVTGVDKNKPKKSYKKPKSRLVMTVISILIVLGILCGGYVFMRRSSVSSQINKSEYQAVFFTNGQVYFGKLHSINSGYFKINDVFYLQTKTPSETNPQKTAKEEDPGVVLVKLGVSQIHGPADEMIINRDQILFFENLKPEGKVSKTITEYNSAKKP